MPVTSCARHIPSWLCPTSQWLGQSNAEPGMQRSQHRTKVQKRSCFNETGGGWDFLEHPSFRRQMIMIHKLEIRNAKYSYLMWNRWYLLPRCSNLVPLALGSPPPGTWVEERCPATGSGLTWAEAPGTSLRAQHNGTAPLPLSSQVGKDWGSPETCPGFGCPTYPSFKH